MSETRDILGFTNVATSPLQRVLVRQRENGVTTSAWRLEVTCDQGSGGIVRIEVGPAQIVFRGEGIFLGATQERMAEVYKALTEPTGGSGPDLELLQLG